MNRVARRITGQKKRIAETFAPLVRLEIASIGAIEAAASREAHAGYAFLMHATKTGKQSNVEQMNTVIRLCGRQEVEDGGLPESMLHLQTLMLQKFSTTAMLTAMRTVEETLVMRYREATKTLKGFELQVAQMLLDRATKHWMILIAHVAQRKDGDSKHADFLPLPLSSYFATPEDRVCHRCFLDRPGELPALEKESPPTYICAACHDEVIEAFPPDLAAQIPAWTDEARKNRVIEKALSRPQKLKAIREVHAVLAGLDPIIVSPSESKQPAAAPGGKRTRVQSPASDVLLPREGATADELAYSDLLFDYRSVRRNW